ncbi:hypothetical protein ACG02S_16230 [Roseateles sp. DC23W]|uniref:Uncharacterized protein n=1 Tax=Pelomonas dachongensis TaxID=3299029 RepID=A0ABW7ET62_9BURK
MKLIRTSAALFLAIALVGCDFQKEADAKFGDQHFKTAISLIELHKVRHGSYPATLDDLQFKGDWDEIALASVEYAKLDSGYALNVTRGWVGKPTLVYPKEFWQGLGLLKSNLKSDG